MKRKLAVIFLGVVITVAAGVSISWWQMRRLSTAFQSARVDGLETVSLGAIADLVLDPGILKELPLDERKPVLEQYAESPQVYRQRASFVKTWLNANSLIEELSHAQPRPEKAIGRSAPPDASVRYRLDGFNNAFCIFADKKILVVMSSGGDGPLSCDLLEPMARRAGKQISSEKLVRLERNIVARVHHA
jgi:hypothetical protein